MFGAFFVLLSSNDSKNCQSQRLFPYLVSVLLGYIIGSFPTAYLFLKWKARLDIRQAGSGNVGAMNAFDVTGSRGVGFGVLAIDLLKGVAAVSLCSMLWGNNIGVLSAGGFAAVVGHDYPIWLKWKGGRGLSTSAGVMLMLGWIFVAVWCSVWAVSYFSSKHIHLSNIVASIVSPLILLVLPEQWLLLTLPSYSGTNAFFSLAVMICTLVLLRHTDSLKEFWNVRTKQSS